MPNKLNENLWSVALTGGIGSGKSAAAHEFEKLGVQVIDSDALAHQITAPNGSAIPLIIESFGHEYIDASGALNRAKMRDLVFNDATALKKLEAITHPLIRESSDKAALAASSKNPPYLIFMIPLLFESNRWEGRYKKIISVDCPIEQQIERVMARNHLEKSEIQKIIAAQVSREKRNSNADFIIDNSGSWDELRFQVVKIHQKIIDLMAN